MNKHLDSNFCLLSLLDLANTFNFYILKGGYSPSEQLAHRLYQSEAASLGSCNIIYGDLNHIQCLPFSPKKQIGDCSLRGRRGGGAGRAAAHHFFAPPPHFLKIKYYDFIPFFDFQCERIIFNCQPSHFSPCSAVPESGEFRKVCLPQGGETSCFSE